MSLDPKRNRYLISLQNDAIPYACGPTNLDVHGIKPAMDRHTIGGGKPEYCFSVIEGVGLGRQPVTNWTVPDVAEARQLLAAADVEPRTLAVQAMQTTAGELLTHYSTFASRGDTWETMDLWQDTLRAIRDLEDDSVEVHTFLQDCLYAPLIIQAHAITSAEPMLLLTPGISRSLQPLQHLLPQCQFLETARTVFRLYWMAGHHAEYGGDEQTFAGVWQSLPWFGVSASLSGTQSLRGSL